MSRSIRRCASAGYWVFAEVAHVSTERPLIDFSIFGAREWHPRMFQFEDGGDGLPAHIYSMASWSPSQSDPLTVSYMCHCQLSSPRLPRLAAMPPWAATVWLRVGNTFVMQAVVKPPSTAPCVARKPAPPAPTTTTSNVWSMNLYASARVEFIVFLDTLGLDADLQYGADARDEQEALSAMFH